MSINRHKVFVSYHHHGDQEYRDKFERLFAQYYDIMISKSVQLGDIDPNLKTETIRQKIRDEYLRDSTVTVVLIGQDTWQRKHVDWEIASSIRQTKYNPRSGLLGILLPTHQDYGQTDYTPSLIPPRLYDNVECNFAKIYDWSDNASDVESWIDKAFNVRNTSEPDNSRDPFKNNRSGNNGWSN